MLTKKQQLKWNKPPKVIKDKKFLEWCKSKALPCFVCGKTTQTELHHIKKHSSDFKDDTKIIVLCGVEHHRLGTPSPHNTPRLFRELYPIEMQLKVAEHLYNKYLSEN